MDWRLVVVLGIVLVAIKLRSILWQNGYRGCGRKDGRRVEEHFLLFKATEKKEERALIFLSSFL